MRHNPGHALTLSTGLLVTLLVIAAGAASGPRPLRAAGACGANPGPPDSAYPAIVVSAPAAGASSTSPLVVSGQARVFEAVVSLALKDGTGATIVAATTQAQAGAPALAPFSTSISFSVAAVTPACLWVFEASARDGSPINIVQVPLTLLPAQPGLSITYPAGWNLVGLPDSSIIPGPLRAFLTFEAGDTAYHPVQNLQPGHGYWAFFTVPTTAMLPFTGPVTLTEPLPAGQYVMVGNPGSAAAIPSGADAVYIYDPATGYQAADQLPPGAGAWAYSARGGTLTITSGPR